MVLLTRKQIRKQFESASAELAALKTPEGLARYMFEKGGDDAFEEAFRAEIVKLRDAAIAEGVGAGTEGVVPEPEPAETYSYQVMRVNADGSVVPFTNESGEPLVSNTRFTEEYLDALSQAANVPRTELQVHQFEKS